MNNKELMNELHSALEHAGFPDATILFRPPARTLEEPWCVKGLRAPVNVFSFTHETLPAYPEQYIAALPITEQSLAVGIGEQHESRQNLASRVLQGVCQTHGCQDNPDQCLFAKAIRSRQKVLR